MSVSRSNLSIPQTTRERRVFLVRGIVQGVGFRPFVHRLATAMQLSGFVRNQSGMVHLEVEGPRELVASFSTMLTSNVPPLAQIESIESRLLPIVGDSDFQIRESNESDLPSTIYISPDFATCADCVRELFDPNDRRFQYPFINCTNCGPRLTIIRGAPYDRQRTTMADFPMCADCRREYDDPIDRRFHAQPIACPVCGPRLKLLTNSGRRIESTDPVADFAAAIQMGQIGALKGLGGYHLVCDAQDDTAVSELRRRKHRDQKPFALMVDSINEAQRYCDVDPTEAALLQSPRRPIVLLRIRQDQYAGTVAASVAPSHHDLGVMLPYTPLHHLLMKAAESQILVMTSGNQADEPIAYDDADAIACLERIADLILTHDRPISIRCDDSVARSMSGRETLLRRSRGYAPEPLSLPIALTMPTLAVGAQLKSTFALGHENHAFLSHHLGDLNHFSAFKAFESDIQLYEELFENHPTCLVHDLHPDYASTTYAQRRAANQNLRLLAVQHHHAHIASCMVEHSLQGPVIGVAFDGTGYGTDGHVWGGEFLIADYQGFDRVAHLRYVGLPGGDAAIREPWRSAMAYLIDANCDSPALIDKVGHHMARTICQMVSRRFNTPLTSSMGRLFDAVAALLGIRTTVSYEGQAAVELEFLASRATPDHAYPFELSEDRDRNGHMCHSVDTRPLIRAIIKDISDFTERELIARRFHSTITNITTHICYQLRTDFALEQVVLSGGVFMNSLLSFEVAQQLSNAGFKIYRQHLVPCNDGGISLGQLAVAAASYRGL